MNVDNAKAQMRKGILEMCILATMADKEAYTSDIIKKLKESELIVVEGTLYPLLNRLKNAGLLGYAWRESSNGPPRKYYHLTGDGREFLKGLKNTWNDLVEAVNKSTQNISDHE
jgi:PadR family transcriptional regulator PadR